MHNVQKDSHEIKNPGAASTAPEAIFKQTREEHNRKISKMHASATTGEGEPRLSSSTVQEAAKDYIQRGWCPLPVPFKEKGPRLKGWQDLRLTESIYLP